MPRLIIQTPGKEQQVYEIVKTRTTIGRSERNDLVLDDPNVSRLHAIIDFRPEGYRITDHNSRNGITVDDKRLFQVLLDDGCVVKLGDSTLRFEGTGAAWQGTTVVERKAREVEAPSTSGSAEFLRATRALREHSIAIPVKRDLTQLEGELREAKRRAVLFELISSARRRFHEAGSPLEVLKAIPGLVFGSMNAERVIVMLWDEEKECLQPAEVHVATGATAGASDLALSQTLLSKVLESQRAVLVQDAKADQELTLRQSVVLSGLRSAICVPMVVRGRLYGLIYVDNRRLPLMFDEDDLEVLSILGQEGALALDTTRSREEVLKQEQTRQAYRRFLPEHLVDLLLSSPEAARLGGARQDVTALFADLRGFTSLAETLPPEEAMRLLNDFFEEMSRVIFAHGGTLDKYLGDGLLAVFGAPIADPDHALHAVQCAMEMQAVLDEMVIEWQAQGRPAIPMGIGVNSGEAIVGNIGSTLHMEYTVIGDNVNIAARLTQHAKAGEILLGEGTWRSVLAQLDIAPLAQLTLKGKREPVQVYRVVRPARTPAAAS